MPSDATVNAVKKIMYGVGALKVAYDAPYYEVTFDSISSLASKRTELTGALNENGIANFEIIADYCDLPILAVRLT